MATKKGKAPLKAPVSNKAAARGKAVVEQAATSRALVSYKEKMAARIEQTRKVADAVPVGGAAFFSFRGGRISLNGMGLGNPVPVVILGAINERAYYEGKFVPGSGQTPGCYAYDDSGVPAAEAPNPVADNCEECPMNQFGTAENGRGKACKEGVKFATIDAGVLQGGAEGVAKANVVQARVSVLNSRKFKAYTNALGNKKLAPAEVVTHLTCEPDEVAQYSLSYIADATIEDPELLDAISARFEEVDELLHEPYPPSREQSQPAKGGGTFRGRTK